jgi:alpha-mannosidase
MNWIKLFVSLFFSLCTGLLSAQSSFIVKRVEPVKYEKRDGSLQVLSYLKTSNLPAKFRVKLDGKEIVTQKTTVPDSLLLWLPLISDKNTLEFTDSKGNSICKQLIDAAIPKDWGYFGNGVIHIIQSSHQDIAWMNTPEYCRNERIEDIINPALEMMKEDKNFTFEMEQTLNLMEFLDKYPNRKDEVIQRYKEGRFLWGATYNQPYEGLATGEQLIRQAYYGRKWIHENLPGCDDFTANNMDVPGRSLQIPQIFAKSGIKYLFVSRMGEGMYDWYSPDGTKLFTFSPGNYGWASLVWRFFDHGAVNAFNSLHHRSVLWSDYFKQHNIPPHYAVLISCDATKPINFGKVIDEWNKIVELSGENLPHLKNSTAEEYFNEIHSGNAHFEKISGERPNLWLYIHGPAHYEATVFKRKAGVVLPAAETFTTIDLLHNNGLLSYPRSTFDRAWMASIYPDHGLGGKNGHITDKIFEDSLAVACNIGSHLLNNALSSITNQIDVQQNTLVVFNHLTWKRNDIAFYELDKTQPKTVVVKDKTGKPVPSQIVEKEGKTFVAFQAADVPSVGYQSYSIGKEKSAAVLPKGVIQYANYCENDFYKMVLGNGGITSLYDKELGKELLETSKFAGGDILDAGYTGNGAGEFTQIKNLTPGDLTPLSQWQIAWSLIHSGALFSEYQNTQPTKNATIVQTVRIYHLQKKIDFDISLVDFSGEHNRQYRIAFPLKMKEPTIHYEAPMAVLEVGKDELKKIPNGWGWDGSYSQRPEEAHPREIQNFISANGSGFGFTMSSCVAVADYIDPSRERAEYPVIQGILLSSHKSCHGEGNWDSQEVTHNYHFSITTHSENWRNGYQLGIAANSPLQVIKKENQGGGLDNENSFMQISNPFVALSLLKQADDNSGVIILLTEMQGEDTDVQITLPAQAKKVIKTNMLEDDMETLNTSGKVISLHLGKNAIETYKLIF